jgi:hypothetical protein
VVAPGTVLTVDDPERGGRFATCMVSRLEEYRDESTRALMLDAGGLDGLSFLAKTAAFPKGALELPDQAWWPETDPPPISNVAEGVVLRLIRDNVVTRRGLGLSVPASQGRGLTVRARPAFDSLLELATRKATRGGVGVSLGLVDTTGSRADLAVGVYLPTDKSKQVYFAEDVGTRGSWRRERSQPTVTRAIMSGWEGDGFRGVATTASQAAGDLWGGRIEQFAEGPSTFDADEMDEAGQEVLDAGVVPVTLTIEPTETGGLQAVRDYTRGDIGEARLPIGVSVKDIVTSVRLVVDADSGPRATVTFGDPDASDPQRRRARLNRALRRDLSKTQRRSR